MGIGSDGRYIWAYGPEGLVRYHEGEARALVSAEAMGVSDRVPSQAILCVHEAGGHLLSGAGELLAFDPEGRVSTVRRKVFAMEHLTRERWAVAERESRHVRIRVGLRGAEAVRLDHPLHPPKLVLPLRFRGGTAPYSRKKRFSELPGELRLRSSLDGRALVLADNESGVVCLWRHDDLDWCTVFRAPTNARSTLEAHPDGDHVIVAIKSDLGQGLLARINGEGKLVSTLPVHALGATCLVSSAENTELLFIDGNELKSWRPSTGGLKDAQEVAGQVHASGPAFVAPGRLVVGSEDEVFFASTSAFMRLSRRQGRWRAEVLPPPDDAATELEYQELCLERIKGPPQFGVDPLSEAATRPWEVTTGDATLEFPLVLMGGPAEGLVIEIGGPGKSLFQVQRAELSGAMQGEFDFEGKTLRIEGALSAGVQFPSPPKRIRRKAEILEWRWSHLPDDCRVNVRLCGVAPKTGAGLLTVRFSFGDAGRTGSLLRGQQLSILTQDELEARIAEREASEAEKG